MVRVADSYSGAERSIYAAAAARFRLPFWDIVMPRNKQSGKEVDTVWGTPKILVKDEVFVKLPQPSAEATAGFDRIKNPLYHFKFPTDKEREKARKLGRRVLDLSG